MRTRILALLACCGLAAASLSAPSQARTFVGVSVGFAPPVRVVERVPPLRVGYVWAPGYWRWYGGRYVWAGGYWLPARVGYRYVPARWVPVGSAWRFRAGYWVRY